MRRELLALTDIHRRGDAAAFAQAYRLALTRLANSLAAKFVGKEPFMLTYGDGVCNIDIPRLLEFHRSHGKLATITAVRQPARFGDIICEGTTVQRFLRVDSYGPGPEFLTK